MQQPILKLLASRYTRLVFGHRRPVRRAFLLNLNLLHPKMQLITSKNRPIPVNGLNRLGFSRFQFDDTFFDNSKQDIDVFWDSCERYSPIGPVERSPDPLSFPKAKH